LNQIIKFIAILSPAERRRALRQVFYLLITAVLDILSLAAVLPLVLILLNPDSDIFRFLNFPAAGPGAFLWLAGLTMLLFIVKNYLYHKINRVSARFSFELAGNLTERQLGHYFAQSFESYRTVNSAEAQRTILHLPIEFANYILIPGLQLTAELVLIILLLLGALLYQPLLVIFLVLFITPSLYWLFRSRKRRLEKIRANARDLLPESLGELNNIIHGFPEILSYCVESAFGQAYLEVQKKLNRNWAEYTTQNLLPARFVEIVTVAGVLLLLVFGYLFLPQHNDRLLLLSVFTGLAYRIMPSLNRIMAALMNLKTYSFTLDLLTPWTAQSESKPLSGEADVKLDSLELKDVVFRYQGSEKTVLRQVSLNIQPGEVIGISGPSGSGKTTLLQVIAGFAQPAQGAILINGRQLQADETGLLRAVSGYVRQDPFLLEGSIRENIVFRANRQDSSPELVQQAVSQAGLSGFVSGLPNGLDTLIGEQGTAISGGQRQRVCIARALYRDSRIFLIDEGTSELDELSEREVLDTILELKKAGKMIIMSAHRASVLAACDRVYQLQDGRLRTVQPNPDSIS
jgi:ABC-type multidrug transport system fused ATPase/permease subunit